MSLRSVIAVSGQVRMDGFVGPATWENGSQESLVVKFMTERMSTEERNQLIRFRGVSWPVTVQLPNTAERKAMIVGFGAKDSAFYLTWL